MPPGTCTSASPRAPRRPRCRRTRRRACRQRARSRSGAPRGSQSPRRTSPDFKNDAHLYEGCSVMICTSMMGVFHCMPLPRDVLELPRRGLPRVQARPAPETPLDLGRIERGKCRLSALLLAKSLRPAIAAGYHLFRKWLVFEQCLHIFRPAFNASAEAMKAVT